MALTLHQSGHGHSHGGLSSHGHGHSHKEGNGHISNHAHSNDDHVDLDTEQNGVDHGMLTVMFILNTNYILYMYIDRLIPCAQDSVV